MRIIVAVVLTSWAFCGCTPEGVCRGSDFGTSTEAGANCEINFSGCGPNADELRLRCDDAGACACFENGAEASTFNDANMCNVIIAAAGRGDAAAADEVRDVANDACDFGVESVE